MDFSAVDAVLEEAVQNGIFPGAVVLVKRAGEVVYRRAHGYRSLEPERTPLNEEVVFDLASLTKPLATTIAIMRFVQERKVGLDDRFSRFFPNFGTYGKTPITVRQLLSHSSGLPAWRPYYKELRKSDRKLVTLGGRSARDFVYAQLQREKIENTPGTAAIYSDLGFLLLGALVEDMSGMGLDQYCREKIYRPLGMDATGFINLEVVRERKLEVATEMIAPTERCPWRKRVLCGEVHDDNAYAMGGVAGHAGLFAPIDDVDRLVSCLVECHAGAHTFLPTRILREFWAVDGTVPGSTWTCGWDTPSPHGSSAGELFSPHSVGHLGFTGTSIWIDLEHQIHVIILSNRVHPRRKNDKIQAFRPVLHNAIMQTLLAAKRAAPPAVVEASATELEDVLTSEPAPEIQEEEYDAESVDTLPVAVQIPLTEVGISAEASAAPPAAVEAPATEPEELLASEPAPEIQEEEHAAESVDTIPGAVPILLTEVEMPVEASAESEVEPEVEPEQEQAEEQKTGRAAEQERPKKMETETAADVSPLQAELDQPSETSSTSPAIRTTWDNAPNRPLTSPARARSQSELHPFLAGYRFRTNPEFVADEAQDSESLPPAAETYAQLSRTQNGDDAADGASSDDSGDGVSSGNEA